MEDEFLKSVEHYDLMIANAEDVLANPGLYDVEVRVQADKDRRRYTRERGAAVNRDAAHEALRAAENAIERAELLLLRTRFDEDGEARVVRAVLRSAKSEVRDVIGHPVETEGEPT